jgi:ABC-type antimicrobial peptide transport system permease subunit
MEPRKIVRLGVLQLSEKKVRTALTILMVVIGVASIVALTSQTAGTSQSIQKTLNALGPTSIIVMPSGKTVFTAADVANLETLKNVSSVTPIVTGSGTFSINGYNSSITVIGLTANGLETLLGNSTGFYQGSVYQDSVTPSAVIGHSVAFASSTDTSKQTASVNQTGTLVVQSSGSKGGGGSSKIATPIVGILQSRSSTLINVDGGVIVSLQYAQTLLRTNSYSELLVKANTAQNLSALTTLLETVYGNNARVINTQQFANTFSSIQSQTSELYVIIAAVALIVAAIGIMNVMLMAVSERIHDIGILKSIGFMNRDVLLIFLFQAMVIGVIGGVTGIGVGVVTSYTVSLAGGLGGSSSIPSGGAPPVSISSQSAPGGAGGAAFFSSSSRGSTSSSSSSSTTEPVFTLATMVEALIIAIAISMIAGIYPAWRASKMEPIDALRIL